MVLEGDTAVEKVTASSMLTMDRDSYLENGSARRECETGVREGGLQPPRSTKLLKCKRGKS